MGFFNSWVEGIIIAVIIGTVIEMLLPNGNNKKYVKVVIGIYVVFSVISPIINKLSNNKFEIDSIINIDKYTEGTEKSETKYLKIESMNQKNINSIYTGSLEKDIREKLLNKGYIAEDIKIIIENNNTYQINKIEIKLNTYKVAQQENTTKISNISKVNEINIEVNIDDIKKEEKKSEEMVTHKEKTEILKYIADTYGINEKSITIY